MQTANADVQNPLNGLRQNARILLDSGSQQTYITESLAKRLNLKFGDKDEFMLSPSVQRNQKGQNLETPS